MPTFTNTTTISTNSSNTGNYLWVDQIPDNLPPGQLAQWAAIIIKQRQQETPIPKDTRPTLAQYLGKLWK